MTSEFFELDGASDDAIAEAVETAARAIGDGGLVVLPTDTVYGVAANAFDPHAVALLLAAKGRGRDFPVPVLVGNPGVLHGLVVAPPPAAVALTERFWPGALTVIVRHSPTLAWDLGDTDGTVAVRMPADPVAVRLLNRSGPLAVSSANRHGGASPTTAAEARDQLGDAVAVYLSGAATASRDGSTIVDVTGDRPRIVRQGPVSADDIRSVVPDLDD